MPSLLQCIKLDSAPDVHTQYEQFSDTKKMIYLTQQLLLCDYVSMFAGSLIQKKGVFNYEVAAPLLLREYRKYLVSRAFQLPKHDFNTGKYIEYHDLMDKMALRHMPSIDDLITMFTDTTISSIEDIQLPVEFLAPFIHSVNGTIIDPTRMSEGIYTDTDEGDKGIGDYEFINPLFLVPEFCTNDTCGLHLVLKMEPALQFPIYSVENFLVFKDDLPLPFRYLAAMDWRGKGFKHILGTLAYFSLEHDAHVMQNHGVCTVCDLCYDIATESCYCRDCKPSNLSDFVYFCKYLHDRWSVCIDDTQHLGDILKFGSSISNDIIGYLQKSSEDITVAEMEAFKTSIFSSFIDKTISATEATDPKKDDDEDKDIQSSTDDAPEGTLESNATTDEAGDTGAIDSNTTGDMSDMDSGEDPLADNPDATSDGSEESEETEDEKIERKIPPETDGIMLELLNPENETLADHLYRKEFLSRVNDLLQQPNLKCGTRTLFMLKQWASKWLYIFSVASLKSFLRNINFSSMHKQ